VECQDPISETARLLALNLTAAMDGRTTRAIATLTGVDYTVIGDVLRGDAWVDLATIARLEHGLGVDLWPRFSDRPST
jgi:transcriptional regulator with XRE-family HTH domain